MQLRAGISCKIFSFITILNKMEFEKFMEFIYFSSFTISVNFPNQLVTDMGEPVLKVELPLGMG